MIGGGLGDRRVWLCYPLTEMGVPRESEDCEHLIRRPWYTSLDSRRQGSEISVLCSILVSRCLESRHAHCCRSCIRVSPVPCGSAFGKSGECKAITNRSFDECDST